MSGSRVRIRKEWYAGFITQARYWPGQMARVVKAEIKTIGQARSADLPSRNDQPESNLLNYLFITVHHARIPTTYDVSKALLERAIVCLPMVACC